MLMLELSGRVIMLELLLCRYGLLCRHNITSKMSYLLYPFVEERNIVDNVGFKPEQKSKTYEGYLFKQGVLFKGWKARWFVLDFLKHQVSFNRKCGR